MENFISGFFAFFFFYTIVVSQLWQYTESKLFFVFIVSHLLLNQLHAFNKFGSHFGMAMIKCITEYTLLEYDCQSIEIN